MAAKRTGDKPLIVDGIKLNVTVDDFDDYDIAEAFAVIAEADEPHEDGDGFEVEFMKATYSLPKLIFKDDWPRIKRELREKNGGKLTNATVFDFVSKVMSEAKAKN